MPDRPAPFASAAPRGAVRWRRAVRGRLPGLRRDDRRARVAGGRHARTARTAGAGAGR